MYAISTTSWQWSHLCVFDSFSKQYFSKYTTSRSMSLLEMPMRQHRNTSILRLLSGWERCNVRSFLDAHLKADFKLILTPIITFLNLSQQVIFICCFMAILSRGKPPRPRIMTEFWSNSRVRIQGNEKRRGEDSSCPKGIEVFVTETVKKGLSRPRERRQSQECTSRLRCSSI